MPPTQTTENYRIGLPFSPRELAGFKLRSRNFLRPSDVGGHLTRRRGQSLEFKDFAAYNPGDDIRHVDWRASLRHGRSSDWVIRTFHSEEKMRMLISIDHRLSMRLPAAIPKLRQACWLASAIAIMLTPEGDRVGLQPLFGGTSIKQSHPKPEAYSRLYQVLSQEADPEERLLPEYVLSLVEPASIWLIISDFYFRDKASIQTFTGLINRMRAARVWVLLVDLDSWPHEKAWLGEGAREIVGPNLNVPDPRYDITEANLAAVEKKILMHKQNLVRQFQVSRHDISCWRWPEREPSGQGEFFRRSFFRDKVLQRLFMKDAAP